MTTIDRREAGLAPVDPTLLRELSNQFHGELVTAADPGYDRQRRVWNGSIDRRPALVARCRDEADIAAALATARRSGLPVAVRGGAHSFPGASVCDDGVVIDLSLMKQVDVDLDRGTVTVEGGVLVGELDQVTQPHGMAVPGGIVSHTGMAGLTLGGGLGWLMRTYGLTIDQLLEVELITADGARVRADDERERELFWALRGGGGNFGIATRFTYRLQPVGPTVLAGPVFWPMADSPRVLRFYREWIAECPNELMTIVIHRRAPALPDIPAELHGQHVVAVVTCYVGDVEAGAKVLAPLRSFGSPAVDLCRPRPYVELQSMFDASYPHGWWYYMRSCDVAELTDDVLDITADHASKIHSLRTAFPIWQLGGARAHVDEDATAFSGRSAGFTFNVTAGTETEDGFEQEKAWVRDFWSDLEPHATGAYVNFLMDEGESRVRQSYGAEKLARLQSIKQHYDPANVFRLNQNIAPATAT